SGPNAKLAIVREMIVRSMFVCCLWPSCARAAAVGLLRRFDVDVAERDRARVLHYLGRLDAAKGTINEAHIVHDRAGKTHHPHDARTRRAPHVAQLDIAHHRLIWPCGPCLVEKINRQDRFGDAPDLDVAHEDIFDHAAAPRVVFEAQRAVEIRTVHVTVFDEDVATMARDLAADDDTAVPVLHRAVAHDDVLRRDAHAPAVVVATRVDP